MRDRGEKRIKMMMIIRGKGEKLKRPTNNTNSRTTKASRGTKNAFRGIERTLTKKR